MASLTRWVAAGAAGCLVLALAYVPPRGAKSSGRPPFFFNPPEGTPARVHAHALADDWRAAAASLHLLTSRRDLAERARAQFNGGSSLLVLGESSDVAITPPEIVDSAAHAAWRQLGLGETKVGVVFVIQVASASPPSDRPLIEEGSAAYLAPDTTDRSTCVAVVPAGRYWTRYFRDDPRAQQRVSFDVLVQFLKAGFGPCAFYAAYGTPSRTVRGWLNSKKWDLALQLDGGPRGPQPGSFFGIADPRYSWYWDAVYALPPAAVACVARRADGCRAAVVAGASDDPVIPLPDVMRLTRRWNGPPRLVEGQRFLGDVARSIGRDRFLSFWTSSQPVDTALAAALKRPVGEWTADWESDFVRPIRLGPTPPLGGLAIALALAGLAVAVVTVTASRRQVR